MAPKINQEIKIPGSNETFDLNDPNLPKAIDEAALTSAGYPYSDKMKRRKYERQVLELQTELGKLQRWVKDAGERVVILFEGRDSAGKGGTIKVLSQYLNPRHLDVVALPKPTDTEQGQLYYQRYISHLPTKGDMTFYDRSWYNRANVERVMGFCSDEQLETFFKLTPDFEKLLVDDGIHLFKFWLTIGQETQLERFHARRHNPLKSWKLSPIDLAALTKWDDYTQAKKDMFERTHTEYAPWTCVRSNDKRRARINVMRHVLSSLDYDGKDTDIVKAPDDKILGTGEDFFNIS